MKSPGSGTIQRTNTELFAKQNYSELLEKKSHVVSKKSANPSKNTPGLSGPRHIMFFGPKSYSHAEILQNPVEQSNFKIKPKIIAATTAGSIDSDEPADELGYNLNISAKTSAKSLEMSEQNPQVDEENNMEEHKIKPINHSHLSSKVVSGGEKVFAKEPHPKKSISMELSVAPYSQQMKTAKAENQFEEDQKMSVIKNGVLKVSKAPDPFENKYQQAGDKPLEIIYSVSTPSNPLFNLSKVKPKSSGLQKAYSHFVISLFESLNLIKSKLQEYGNNILMPTLKLARPSGLKCIFI